MRMNGLYILVTFVVTVNSVLVSKASVEERNIRQTRSSGKRDNGLKNAEVLYHGSKGKRHSSPLAKNNFKKHRNDDNHLAEEHGHKEKLAARKKGERKSKHRTGVQKTSHRTRTQDSDDILSKIKKEYTSKHSRKSINKEGDIFKNDKRFKDNNRGKEIQIKEAGGGSDTKEDRWKNKKENAASEDEKEFPILHKILYDKMKDKIKSKLGMKKKDDDGKSGEKEATSSNDHSVSNSNKKMPETTASKDSETSDKKDDKKMKKKHRKYNDDVHQKKKKKHRKYNDDDASKFLNETEMRALRDALLLHPFNIWKFKDRFNSMSDLGIHEALLQDVVENRWNRRLKHKLFKVFKGENIHMAVIGGSNTAGGGIQQDEGRTDGIFFRVILDWWQKTITPLTGSHLKTRQIAMGGTGSDFFQYCHRSYVQKDVDLILLEMSVNDLHELPNNVNLSLPIEQLTRQLLEYPTEPALLYVNLLSGRSYYQGCTNLEDFGQRLLSDAYEVTTFSWRDAVCPVIDGKFRVPLKGCTVICKDGHHINQLGHAHISLMVINLFRDLLLDNMDHVHELSRLVFHDEVILPKPVFIARQSKVITDPVCWTTVTPNYKRKIITNGMEVGVMENYGFDYVHDKAIGGGHCHTAEACRADAYSGWTGQDVGASLTLSFTVPPLGHKRRIQSRSVVFATRTCWKCGVAEVWLDDDVVNRRQIRAQSQYAQTLSQIIALRVNPGDHTMSVKVVHPGLFTAVGVMLGPPDGPY
ncbi:uncharacterized protein LOC114525798 [Dendronephthya gigantea]|uniref:uncharacterized protein LOC114525798 n=1 Tax=Dendronephthya gigantea TaxID=151771 RepID=UPI001069AC61|nr:uncharacterized protein LOC114525798 [Dendronephthya gigantea]